ncbi:MAG: trimethyllysine dioxygenase, partial [Actinomycetia bacterium]|nr:trimethyllysine dioxygenase [Actinomycetes bacterium]
ATITDHKSDTAALTVTWEDGATTTYPWIWLRDHAHDEATFHPVTMQRNIHTASIDPNLAASHVKVESGEVSIAWSAGDNSVIPVEFLARFRTPGAASVSLGVEPVLWDADMIGAGPRTPYDQIMGSDQGMLDWLTNVAQYGFGLAVGVPATGAATKDLLEKVAYIRRTIFGGFWEFEADMSKADTAYTNVELLSHTDATYSNDAPVQLLHCLYFEGSGGESTIADSFRVARELKQQEPQHYNTLSTVLVPGQYIGDGSHLMAARPVLRHDDQGNLLQVSFNNADRAPFLLPLEEMVAFYDAIRALDNLSNEHRLQWRHQLEPGEAMLFDNWRVMHGRASYQGGRKLCGAYLNREDFESRIRMLQTSISAV